MKLYQRDLSLAFLIKIALLIALSIFFSVYKTYNHPHKVESQDLYQ